VRLRAQLAFADDGARWLLFARAVVSIKIRKQVTLLQRFARRDNAETALSGQGRWSNSPPCCPAAALAMS